ncbi:hypothetical protein M422DRAFT_276676 [Sphaerobolus stellatus SS14]|uniref:Uncharacterized protein n=1 Tax=Sphaerobolus stellatus (strain SS14) TaxID=990650 RepID=A0A0C9U1G0_SPHS4|nr:hypothetical protein M422DRAFT_276676 [Sphaerobolus stellatus SS14]
MPSVTSFLTAATGLVAVFMALGANADNVKVTANCSTDTWTFNQENQSPCEVSARLQAFCHGGVFQITPLAHNKAYSGPQKGASDPCVCSTVTYSLVAACAACQDGAPLPWTNWITNCAQSDISISKYPEDIPQNTSIPQWAFLDVVSVNDWDVTASLNLANQHLPDITETKDDGTPINSTTSSTSIAPSPTLTVAGSNAGPNPGPSSGGGSSGGDGNSGQDQDGKPSASASAKQSNVGPIVGGVVGGVGALLLIGGLAVFLIRRKSRRRNGSTPIMAAAVRNNNNPDFTRPAPVGSPLPIVAPFYINGTPAPEQQTQKGYVQYPQVVPSPPPQYPSQRGLSVPAADPSYTTEPYIQDRQSLTYFPNPYGSPSPPATFTSTPSPPYGQRHGTAPFPSPPAMGYSGSAEV